MTRSLDALYVLLHFVVTRASSSVSGTQGSEPCLPFYISTFEKHFDLNFFVFDVVVICIFILCMWPAKNLDYLKRVLMSGLGILMCTGHLLTFISTHVDLSQLVWSIAIVAGVAAGFFSTVPPYENIFISVTGAYISALIITSVLRSDNTMFYFITFFVVLAIYILMSRLSPVYHYAICKSLFVAQIFLVIVELNMPIVKPFRSGFYGTSKQFMFHGLIGLVLFFGCAAISFVLTLNYDRVKAKVSEYKDKVVATTTQKS